MSEESKNADSGADNSREHHAPFTGPWSLVGRFWRRPLVAVRGADFERLLLIGPDVGTEHAR